VAIFAAFQTLLFTGRAESVAASDAPVMPAFEQPPNKAAQTTAGSVLFVFRAHGAAVVWLFAFVG
jgi:hypothetical protein